MYATSPLPIRQRPREVEFRLVGECIHLMEGGKFAQGVGSVFLKLKEPLRYRWWDGSGRTAPHGLVEFCRIGNHPLLRLPDKTFIGIDFVISGQKAEIVS